MYIYKYIVLKEKNIFIYEHKQSIKLNDDRNAFSPTC